MDRPIDDVDELIKLGIGDQRRLEHIQKTLKDGRALYDSDRVYLQQQVENFYGNSNPENIEHSTSQNNVDTKSTYNKIKEESSENQGRTSFCSKCGNRLLSNSDFCSKCGTELIKENNQSKNKSNMPWFRIIGTLSLTTIIFLGVQTILPFPFGLGIGFFSLFVIPWMSVKKMTSHRKKSFVIVLVLSVFISAIVFSSFINNSSTNEIDDVLSEFPENIQEIKRIQIANCENNMGYLQSMELGDMIKEKCINSVLGK